VQSIGVQSKFRLKGEVSWRGKPIESSMVEDKEKKNGDRWGGVGWGGVGKRVNRARRKGTSRREEKCGEERRRGTEES
jgi:hypothetical protein